MTAIKKSKSKISRRSRNAKVFGKPAGKSNDRYIGLVIDRTPEAAKNLNKILSKHTSQKEGVQKAIEEYASKL